MGDRGALGSVLLQGAGGRALGAGEHRGAQLARQVRAPIPLRGTILGGELYFQAYLANHAIGLFRTDGTPGGTVKLTEFAQAGGPTYYDGYGFEAVALDKVVVGCSRPSPSTWALWVTDGTPGGSGLVEYQPGLAWGFTRLGNAALYLTFDGTWQLRRTDGTVAGTSVVHAFPSGASVDVDSLARVGDVVYLAAGDGGTGVELWRSDGTAAGTYLVKDVNPGPGDADPADLTRVGDALYFSADAGGGRELWRSDGTAAGTARAAAVPWGYAEGPRHLTALGERLFFAHGVSGSKDRLYVLDDATGALSIAVELDGTGGIPEGIREVHAIGSRRVFFSGNDVGGAELWVSDGTSAGTSLYEDVLAGGWWSQPAEMMLSDGRLWFTADTHPTTRALHHRDVGATAQSFGVGCSRTGRLPELSADDPVLGGSSRVRLRDAEPSSPVLVFYGPQVAPTALGSGCFAHLDPALATLLVTGATDVAGAWTSAPLPLPADPALQEVQLVVQALVGPTGTAPLGFDLSSAVLLHLGS